LSNKYFAGESAIIQAACLLRHGQADVAIVLAGDAILRSIYSWYEEAGLLSPACYNSDSLRETSGFIPSEGVAALVMESSARRNGSSNGRCYARIGSGRWAAGGTPAEMIRRMLGGSLPSLTICSGNGAPCAGSETTILAREISGNDATIIPSQVFAQGLAGTGALFHLILGLSSQSVSGQALLLGTAGKSEFAAIHLELP
jgi:Beta-ketoacyl synthase, N-terminal domain